jgi:hypothetical protein
MPTLSMVWIWPGQGWADQLWSGSDGVSPEVNSLARTAVRIAAAFSRELSDRGVKARASEIRFFASLSDSADMTVSVTERHTEGFERGVIKVPSGFHLLTPEVRAGLVSEAMELGVARLVELAGSSVAPVHDAMAAVRDARYEFRWAGPRKFSPDRKHRAGLRGELFDDGYGRLRAVVEEVRTGEELTSSEIRSECSIFAFERAAKSFRWNGSHQVEFWNGGRLRHTAIAEVDTDSGMLSSNVDLPVPLPNNGDQSHTYVTPKVVFEGPPAVQIGSGFSFGNSMALEAVSAYVNETVRITEQISSEEAWIAWWVSTGMKDVWIPVWLDGSVPKNTLRVTGSRLNGTRVKPVSTIPDDVQGAIELARSDFENLLERIRARFGLQPHPRIQT